MTKTPVLKPKELEDIVLETGFKFIRQKGSHRIYKKGDKLVVLPFHNKELKKGTVAYILKQIEE